MVRRSTVRRAVWLLPLTATIALVCALAAFGATTRSSAAPTLVVDNSFTIKTSDPQRAFDPTARCGSDVLIVNELSTTSVGAAEERSEEHTSELQSHSDHVCRLL